MDRVRAIITKVVEDPAVVYLVVCGGIDSSVQPVLIINIYMYHLVSFKLS